MQFSLNVQNNTGYTGQVNIYLLPISSGFFETIKGSSRIIKGVLTEQDILSAPMSAPSPALDRVVGGKMTSLPTHSMPDGSQMPGIAHQLKPRKGRAMHNYM